MDLLRHLRFFAAVAESRHFGQAAAALGMTQPPLSQGVQRLEGRLGVRLLERSARGVRLSDAGAALLPHVEDLLGAADRLVEDAATWAARGALRLGVAGDLEELVPVLVRATSTVHGAVTPVVAGSVELVDRLRSADVDVAVVRHPGVVDGTRPREVCTIPTFLVGAEEPPAGSGPVRLSDVTLPVAVPPRRHHPAAHDQLVDTLRRLGHSGATLEEPDDVARRALVAAGRAVRLTTAAGTGHPLEDHPLPVRVRVVLPEPAARRPDVDHEGPAVTLERALR